MNRTLLQRSLRACGALLIYGALVVFLTWPLATHLTTHLPDTNVSCRFDTPYMGWVLAWETHALTSSDVPLLDTNIYYPAHRTLFYGDTGWGALPFFMPLFLASGNPTLALNLVIFGAIALTAWTLHLVVEHWTGSFLAGFVAGWTLLMTRLVLWDFLPAAPSYAVLPYFPLIVWLAATPHRRFSQALLLLPLIVLQCLADLAYVTAAVIVPLTLLGLGRAVRPATRAAGLRLLAVVGLALLALAPLHAQYLAIRADNPLLSEQTVWWLPEFPFSWPYDLPGLLSNRPTAIPLAAVALILAGGGCAVLLPPVRGHKPMRRAWTHGAFWAIVGLLISLPPYALYHGALVRLPHYYLERLLFGESLPIHHLLRVPERLRIASLMGLCILTGVAFAEMTRRFSGHARRRTFALAGQLGVAALVAVAMYAQYTRGIQVAGIRWQPLPDSYPLAKAAAADSPLLTVLRSGQGPLLELPVGGDLSPEPSKKPTAPAQVTDQADAMYRSIFHWRPLVNGYDSYYPVGFRDRMTLAQLLPDPQALAELRKQTGLTTVLVHTDRLSDVKRQLWYAIATRSLRSDLVPIAADGPDLLFTVRHATPASSAALPSS